MDCAGNARERHFPGAPFLRRVDWGLKRAVLHSPVAADCGRVAEDAAHLRTAGTGLSLPVLQHQTTERDHPSAMVHMDHKGHGQWF